MAIGSSVSSDLTTARKQPHLRWSRLMQLLTLVAVFAGGYGYAKIEGRFQPQPKVDVTQRIEFVPQIPAQYNQIQTFAQNPVQSKHAQHRSQNFAHNNSTPLPPLVNSSSANQANSVYFQAGNAGSTVLSTAVPHTTFGSAPAYTDKEPQPVPPILPSASYPSYPSPTHTFGYSLPQPNGAASPEELAANASIAELVAKIHQAKKDEKGDLSDKLKAQIVELFKLRHAAQAKEIEELEKQLEHAKSLHAKRQEKQDEIVERRLRQLMNELDDLDWYRNILSSRTEPGWNSPPYAAPSTVPGMPASMNEPRSPY